MTESPAGSRRSRRTTIPLPRPGTGLAAVVVLAIAGVLVLLTPSEPEAAPRPAGATGEVVTETMLGCTGLDTPPGQVKTAFGVGLAGEVGRGSDGIVEADPGGPLMLSRGDAGSVPLDARAGFRVFGLGGRAPGFFAWRADTGPTSAVLPCAAPRASWWFTGAGAALDHESTLTLANVDAGTAVVDLRVITPQGEADLTATGGRGIEVQPGERVSLSLVQLVPQADEVALWVHATRGRVVAAVSDRFAVRAGAKLGHEWLPSAITPARVVRLAGIPAEAQSRTLVIGNPSEFESVVTVEVAGTNGRFIPDIGDLTIGPGQVSSVDLSRVLPGEPYAVRVLAERPVVATVRTVKASGDTSYAGAAEPLTEIAALPVVGPSTVQLTAGSETSRVTATAYAANGRQVATTRVSLARFATGTWPVPAGSSYVVLEPLQGNAFGAMVYAVDLAAAVPFADLPISIRVPPVRPAA